MHPFLKKIGPIGFITLSSVSVFVCAATYIYVLRPVGRNIRVMKMEKEVNILLEKRREAENKDKEAEVFRTHFK